MSALSTDPQTVVKKKMNGIRASKISRLRHRPPRPPVRVDATHAARPLARRYVCSRPGHVQAHFLRAEHQPRTGAHDGVRTLPQLDTLASNESAPGTAP